MWTLTAELQEKVMELRCYHRILGISFIDHITKEKVCKTIRNHINPYEDFLMIVKKGKLMGYGHITRLSGLTKTILQGTAEGKRCRGRQRKQKTENAEEWTGKSFAETQAMAHNHQEWYRLVSSTSMQCPHNSS